MTKVSPSLQIAIEVYNQPLAHRRIPFDRKFAGMLDVIKIAAGDEETIRVASDNTGLDQEALTSAASFYLQRLLLESKGNAFRLLALPDGASEAEIATHKRWLLKWLHPDRNHNSWETLMFTRVAKAASDLKAGLVPVAPPAKTDTPNKHHRRHVSRRHRLAAWRIVRKRKPGLDWSALLLRRKRPLIFLVVFAVTLILVVVAAKSSTTTLLASNWKSPI